LSVPYALSPTDRRESKVISKRQRTLRRPISISGVGLFTGQKVDLTIRPADANQGIVFQRVDLHNKPLLPAKLENLKGNPRCTIIGTGDIQIQTVEHLLSALRAFDIDNACIQISASEVPILDGSALGFVELIEQSGITEQEETKSIFYLGSPVFYSQKDVHIVALPSEEYRISYTLHYPQSKLLGSQFYSVCVDAESFKTEIAPSRTFSLYEEVNIIIEKGLLKGGSLENGVIIKDDTVLNSEGLRFKDEMVRHKILDMIGDLSLVSLPFIAHIIAIRSGHASNNAFAKELLNHIKMENS
jgi:UDP-3-O-[3-hydroxymyristoyl] N-acetylglucosamine deacetylase